MDHQPGAAVPASCCSGGGRASALTVPGTEARARADQRGAGASPVEHREVLLGGGTFLMGDAFGEGYPGDGELPVHEVTLAPFGIDVHPVTNAQFATFVQQSGHRTDAQIYGSSAVFHLLVDDRRDVRGQATGAPWWLDVVGADWAHPRGPGTTWHDVPDHPVVHVSHDDAVAYARWAGRHLPTEAQWEYAARGGLVGARYAWGDELTPAGTHRANIWQGTFPSNNTGEDGFVGTAPADAFAPNGYGLHGMAGNVWEWCADWFSPHWYRRSPHHDPIGPKAGLGRVMRGGSYLCHESYCNRYRVAARTGNTTESSSGNTGFRTAQPA